MQHSIFNTCMLKQIVQTIGRAEIISRSGNFQNRIFRGFQAPDQYGCLVASKTGQFLMAENIFRNKSMMDIYLDKCSQKSVISRSIHRFFFTAHLINSGKSFTQMNFRISTDSISKPMQLIHHLLRFSLWLYRCRGHNIICTVNSSIKVDAVI